MLGVGLPITQEKLDYTFHRSNIHERRRLATFAGGTQERNGCSICVGLEIGIYDTDISQITFNVYSTYRNQMCIYYTYRYIFVHICKHDHLDLVNTNNI